MFDPDEVHALKGQPKSVVLGAIKSCFMEIIVQLQEVGDEEAAKNYIAWLQQQSVQSQNGSELVQCVKKSSELSKAHHETIIAIKDDLKCWLQQQGEQDHSNDAGDGTAVIFDQFLYNDVNEALRVKNLNSLYKCTDCGSSNINPRPLISHSASVESLIQLFTAHLPDLSNLKLLDLGCGLGSILYGAYYFSNAPTICGIELNSKFCDILSTVIQKYNLHDRVSVVNGDLRAYANLIKSCDVVTFNNVLEYFVPVEIQKEIWIFLCQNLKRDTLFVTNPDLPTLLKPLNLVKIIDEWVIPFEPKVDTNLLKGFPDTDETFFVYKVIKHDES